MNKQENLLETVVEGKPGKKLSLKQSRTMFRKLHKSAEEHGAEWLFARGHSWRWTAYQDAGSFLRSNGDEVPATPKFKQAHMVN